MNLLLLLNLAAFAPGAEPATAGAERLARYRAGEAALRAGRNADAETELTAALGENAQVRLRKGPNMPGGFRVHTAYPTK